MFPGTDKRKPLNLCEVAITLTDCEGMLGSEFNEVEVARRVHRDGGSNYYINGKACRLKDIQRLFMDTGIGRTSYSIMAQGQIDQILSSKPEERRAVFEEAAGISKYKAQRKEALNKLGHVETNLNRVTDVISEISRQIGSLRRQATKAIRYKKVSHKLRHLDIGYSAYQFGTLSAALEDIGSSAGDLEAEVDELQKSAQNKEHHLMVNKEERQALTQKVQDAQQSVFDLKSMKEQATNAAHMAQIKINSMMERIEQAREEIASFESQIAEMAAKLDEHSADKQMHMDVLGNSDEIFQERNRELDEIERKMLSMEQEIQLARIASQDAERNVSRCREQMAALEVEARTSESRMMRLEEELVEHSESQTDASNALEEFRTRIEATRHLQEELQTGLEGARDKVEETRQSFRTQQGEIQQLDRTVAQKTARVKLLQQLQEKLEGYGEGAKALLKGKMQGDLQGKEFSPIANEMSVKDGYGQAVEALLGSAVEAITVGDADTVIEIFQQLEDRKVGRVCLKLEEKQAAGAAKMDLPDWLPPALNFIEIDKGDHTAALKAVLEASYIVEEIGLFLKWWETNPDFRFLQVASKKGETVDARGIVTGGYKKAKNSSILQREMELRQTQDELKADQKALEEAKAKADSINQALESAEDEVETKRQEINEANRELSTLQAEIRNAEKAVQEQRLKAERLETERDTLEEIRSRSAEKLENAKTQLSDEVGRVEQARQRLEGAETGIEEVRNLRDERREGLTQAKFDLQEKKQRLDILNQGLVEIEQRRNELNRLIEAKTSDIENWEQQSEEEQEAIVESQQRSEAVDTELEEAKTLVEQTREGLISTEQKISVLEKEQAEVRARLDTLKGSLNNQQVQIAEKKSRVEFVQEEITREYGVELKDIDWKYYLWKARQPVDDLPKLDLDTDAEEANDEEGLEGEIAPVPAAEGESGEEADVLGEGETQEAEVQEATEGEEGEAFSGELPAPAPKMPTEEELAELDSTDWKKIQKEVQTLRKRIQNMGAVNLVAIEEYGELRERHLFLKTQYDDLVTSRDKLVEAIDEINTKSREQFSDTFGKIRENFRGTFQTLFGGGKADLQLIETDDVLESGIDIIAQPPGTRLKGVGLLSGGQRTMTAVGLLFAIYMVKPSPFCLLDELDAPLDESNIGRFTKLLKQFTDQSQFIIVTHNKRTVAAAQAIYGVTMEEKGVSKVVSMKFNSEHEDEDLVSLELAQEAV
ncbi:MAG: chromosome segregation protein SMC [Verrucomicrobiota bacterium]